MQPNTTSMRLSRFVPLGFSAIVVVMIVNGLFSQLTVNGLSSTIKGVIHSYRVQTALQELEEILVDVQLGERGYIITKSEDFLEPFTNAQNKINDKFDEVRELLKDDPEQLRRLEELEASALNGVKVLSQNVGRIRGGKIPSLQDLRDGKKGLEIMRDKIEEMLEAEDNLLEKRQRSASEAEFLSILTSLGGTIIGTVLGLLIIIFVIRKVVKPINEVAYVITSSSTEIAATVAQQENIATEQASSVNQTTVTMEELGASSRQAAEQAEEAAAGAQQALLLAEGGTKAVELTLGGMTTLQEKVGAIAEAIVLLSEQTSQIGSISAMVADLANQTNMLALNAAVEAVRAGEQGKGFGVVADEVRKLADQSKKSAERINILVSEIQTAINSTVMVTEQGTKTVESGVQLAHQTANAFQGVTEAVNQVVVNSQHISLSAKQQAIAIQQVATAMNILNQGAVQTASGITQTKMGTQKLNEAASTLQAVV